MREEQEQSILFDVNAQFRFKLLSGTEKIAVATRFGTDAEWSTRTRKQQLVKNVLGRGKAQYSSAGSERADFELWEKIKDPSSADLDEFEAEKMISKLAQTALISCDRSADTFRVTIEAFRIETVHTLRMPTQKQLVEYGRAAMHVYDHRRSQEFRQALEPAGALYDELAVGTDGYASVVPIIHKSAVIQEIVQELEAAESGEDF